MFEILEHPADIGFRAFGETLPNLFANAALAMLSIAADITGVVSRYEYRLCVEGTDLQSTLVGFLSEVLYRFDRERIIFADFQVTVAESSIHAIALGEPRDAERHAARLNVKAVTQQHLKIERRGELWVAEVHLDV